MEETEQNAIPETLEQIKDQAVELTQSLGQDQDFLINAGILTGITVGTFVLLKTLIVFISSRLRNLNERRKGNAYGVAAEMLSNTSSLLLFAFSLTLGLRIIELAPRWEGIMSHAWFLALALQIAIWLNTAVRLWMESLLQNNKKRNMVTATIIGIMLRMLIWVMMLLSVLGNLGVNITAMVASLGVGGIAIALAVQTLLGDLFASLSIGIDKPFEHGDFVVFNGVAGTIEHIGLKTTRIRSLSGEQIICSNANLQAQVLHNYKRMSTRRIVFQFGVTYDTPTDRLRTIPDLVKEIIDGIEQIRFDRAHFQALDDYQLTFEVVYIVRSSDYGLYMDAQQMINLQLLDAFRARDIHFAFPTQSIEFAGGHLPKMTTQVRSEPARSPVVPGQT